MIESFERLELTTQIDLNYRTFMLLFLSFASYFGLYGRLVSVADLRYLNIDQKFKIAPSKS
jgi:hypothetical protein